MDTYLLKTGQIGPVTFHKGDSIQVVFGQEYIVSLSLPLFFYVSLNDNNSLHSKVLNVR